MKKIYFKILIAAVILTGFMATANLNAQQAGVEADEVKFTAQPENITGACMASDVVFNVVVENADTLKWQVSTNNGTQWSDIEDNDKYSGSDTDLLIVTVSLLSHNNQYRCVGTNDEGSVNSDPAVLSIDLEKPQIQKAPNDDILFSNGESELPDYTPFISVTDNCDDDLTIVQIPAPGTVISGDINQVTIKITDKVGNESSSNLNVQVIDNIQPTVELASTELVNGKFEVTVTFSEQIYGLEKQHITVDNGIVNKISSETSTTHTAFITPGNSGEINISIAPGMVGDIKGNMNKASDTIKVTADLEDPLIELEPEASEVTSNFELTLHFNEPVQEFTSDVFTIINGYVVNDSLTKINDTSYSCTIAALTEGFVSVFIEGDKVSDAAGNTNSKPSNLVSVNFKPASSINDKLLSKIKILPNPADQNIRLSMGEITGIMDVTIYNMNGQQMQNEGIYNNTTLDVSGLTDGMYRVIIKTQQGLIVKPLVIQR
ncbi:MAG: Ig-like domain-containing protein [Bacteroidales bacterium]|nr:Ig-like domain-containing protein [Bacteroidales bacterium]